MYLYLIQLKTLTLQYPRTKRTKTAAFTTGAPHHMSRDMGTGNLTDGCGSDGSSGEGGLGEVLAGVAIAVVASVGINIGNNVQVLPRLHCIRSQGGLGWPGIGVRVRVRGGLRLQGFSSAAAQPAPPEGSASGQSFDPRP